MPLVQCNVRRNTVIKDYDAVAAVDKNRIIKIADQLSPILTILLLAVISIC